MCQLICLCLLGPITHIWFFISSNKILKQHQINLFVSASHAFKQILDHPKTFFLSLSRSTPLSSFSMKFYFTEQLPKCSFPSLSLLLQLGLKCLEILFILVHNWWLRAQRKYGIISKRITLLLLLKMPARKNNFLNIFHNSLRIT